MSQRRCSLFLGLFLLLTSTTNAQVLRSAQDYFSRGEAQYAKGDFERAVASFTRVIEADRPRRNGFRGGQNWTTSTPENDSSDSDRIILVSRLTAPAYINRGLARVQMGDLEGALSDCDQALVINPRLVQAYINRGAIRWSTRDLDGALADFDQVIQKNPRDAQAYNNRGNLRTDRHEFSGALSDLDQAIRLDPGRAEFYCDRGVARLLSGDNEGAFVDFELATKTNPDSSWAYYCRARGWYNRKEFNRTLADLNRAIELDPKFARAFGDRGLVHLRLRHEAEAEKDFAECLRLDPTLKTDLERNIKGTRAIRVQ